VGGKKGLGRDEKKELAKGTKGGTISEERLAFQLKEGKDYKKEGGEVSGIPLEKLTSKTMAKHKGSSIKENEGSSKTTGEEK